MDGLSNLSGALNNAMGNPAEPRGDDGHRVEIDRGDGVLVVIESAVADAVRVSRCLGGTEDFACYVQFAGEENPKTLTWKFQPMPAVRGVFSVDGKPADHKQIAALRDMLGALPLLKAAA